MVLFLFSYWAEYDVCRVIETEKKKLRFINIFKCHTYQQFLSIYTLKTENNFIFFHLKLSLTKECDFVENTHLYWFQMLTNYIKNLCKGQWKLFLMCAQISITYSLPHMNKFGSSFFIFYILIQLSWQAVTPVPPVSTHPQENSCLFILITTKTVGDCIFLQSSLWTGFMH